MGVRIIWCSSCSGTRKLPPSRMSCGFKRREEGLSLQGQPDPSCYPPQKPPAKPVASLLLQDPAAVRIRQPCFIHRVFCLEQGSVELLQRLCLIIHGYVQTRIPRDRCALSTTGTQTQQRSSFSVSKFPSGRYKPHESDSSCEISMPRPAGILLLPQQSHSRDISALFHFSYIF